MAVHRPARVPGARRSGGSAERVDVVVVGGGSAGSVVAGRLVERGAGSVLVLEAGGPVRPWDVSVRMPLGMSRAVGDARYDWKFTGEEEPWLFRRRVVHPRGRALGGSSAINGMLYQRGHAADYDGWAALTGDGSWNYAHLVPYFQRVEAATRRGAGPTRGRSGAHVLTADPASGPLHEAFFAAAQQAGHPVASDPNEVQDGVAPFEKAQSHGRRVTAADAYLTPHLRGDRHGGALRVQCHALVTRVVVEGGRAVGVRYRVVEDGVAGPELEVRAGEVVLAAGAFATPQLLLLSGIGPRDELAAAGVDVVHHLPGVGRDLQDHLGAFVQHRCTAPLGASRIRQRPQLLAAAARWLALGSGPGASTHIEAGGFLRTTPDQLVPEATVFFSSLVWPVAGMPVVDGPGYQLYAYPGRVTSRGSITLRSTDPSAAPVIRNNYLSTESDRQAWVRVLRTVRELLSQPAFERYDGGEVVPGRHVVTDDEILSFVRRTARTGLHPTSTARMGHDDAAVLDPATLGVHGLPGLRVVDASAIPLMPNGNSYAPVMVLAEKAADLISGAAAPAPAEVPLAARALPGALPPLPDPLESTAPPLDLDLPHAV
ncbi:GMC family oxidoreductase N-terminal domain-containing protein [Quadrisphaera sp. INWT6]|uniref:GMC family oxidoreductase N-terminal domain-containing protein n=1 Tax=Quadrisphaera sp. INWT6 TaxID=2596917 RepID=UPI001892287F|nr:GMC family oxidoreductase N-terminal domain-containing protein [Quadrisphaera sp. INWT6]MBF5080374.1 choline dehydrogenase [Quadrisphaera sp. INWT6]